MPLLLFLEIKICDYFQILVITFHTYHQTYLFYSSNFLLPPANEVCEGYVFTGVCLSTEGGGVHGRGRHVWQGGMHGRGVCVAGGHVWRRGLGWGCALQGGMCMAGGMHGGGHARQGACMVGACMAWGCVWQGACMAGGMHGGGNVWQGGICSRGACVADTMRYSQ